MLAAHADQENLVASHQAAAAAKPLNQGIKGYGAKTPASKAPPKTPLKVPLNDENLAKKNGNTIFRTVGKGTENHVPPTGKKGATADNSAFVTPAGPRTRAPLGMKTTNAKARAFATPAPQTAEPSSERTGVKSSGPRLRRAKVKVHQATPVKDPFEDEERDIEYMPPRGTPLNDDPDDLWPADMDYSILQGENLVRGVYETYFNPIGDDGLSRSERRHRELLAEIDQKNEELLAQHLEEALGPFTDAEREACGLPPKPVPKSKPEVTRPTSSASTKSAPTGSRRPLSASSTSKASVPSSRTAASALSHYSNPTASVRARSRSALSDYSASSAPVTSRKKSPPINNTAPKASNPSTMRHQAATAASKTTLGYGKGRAVSSTVRKPLSTTLGHQRAVSQPATMATKPAASTSTTRTVPAPTRPTGLSYSQPRSSWARPNSAGPLAHSTASNLQAEAHDEPEIDEELELLRELQNRTMKTEVDESGWFGCASNADALAFGFDDEEEEFQFRIPELPEPPEEV